MMDERPREQPQRPEEETEPEPGGAGELENAAEGDDAERLRVLEELYNTLESELEGDLDQEESPGR